MIANVRRGARYALTAIALALPATAAAETVTPATPPDTSAVATTDAGPTAAAAAVAVRARPDASADVTAMQRRAGLGQPVALMVVGFAGLIAGALIGGDPGTLIMIAGAGFGLWGLYQYLQ